MNQARRRARPRLQGNATFLFGGVSFEVRTDVSASRTKAFKKVRDLDEDSSTEEEIVDRADLLIRTALTRISLIKWRYLNRDRPFRAIEVLDIRDVVLDVLVAHGCILLRSDRVNMVHLRNHSYTHQRVVAIARLPAENQAQRDKDVWRYARATNPEYDPLAILPEFASSGRSSRVRRVPWVDDEGTWKGGRRPA